MKVSNTHIGHERLVKNKIDVNNVQRVFVTLVMGFVFFANIYGKSSAFYLVTGSILSFFIVCNIIFVLFNVKSLNKISDIPINILSIIFEIISKLSMGFVYFLVISPVSLINKVRNKSLFKEGGWQIVDKQKIDYREGF
tara:strand:- start:557 stop:973 length:417 start_codon:yes stop_codon:yes gene_type:complete